MDPPFFERLSQYNKPWEAAFLAHYKYTDFDAPLTDEIYSTALTVHLREQEDALIAILAHPCCPSTPPRGTNTLLPPVLRRSQRVSTVLHYPHPRTGLPVENQLYECASMFDTSGDNGIVGGGISLQTLFHIQSLLDKHTGSSEITRRENAKYIIQNESLPGFKAGPNGRVPPFNREVRVVFELGIADQQYWCGPTKEFMSKANLALNILKFRAIVRIKVRVRQIRMNIAQKVYAPGGNGALKAKTNFESML